ncbi:MAG: methyltransferase [bacterium]|nr:methyltransferase [bacterium]
MNQTDRLLQYMHGYKVSYLLFTAAELKLFSHLEQYTTAQSVAAATGLTEVGMAAILNIFTGLGLLERKERQFRLDETYRDLLTEDSPTSMLPLFNLEKHLLTHHNTFRQFKKAITAADGEDRFNKNKKDGIAHIYGTAMDNGGQLAALHIARAFRAVNSGTVLDIGGGAGTYSIRICQTNKNLQADIYDKKEMKAPCLSNVRKSGLMKKITFYDNDINTATIDKKYEGILISNLLHLFPLETIRDILKKASEALQDNGLLIIHDFFLENDCIYFLFTRQF